MRATRDAVASAIVSESTATSFSTALPVEFKSALVNSTEHTSAFFDNLSITNDPPAIVQENHYDPWGWNLVGIETEGNPEHKWQFNEKEKIEELGLYDYIRRYYDPILGRFITVDALAEQFNWWTPFQFAGNRPTLYVDLDGMEPAYRDPVSGKIIPASDHLQHRMPTGAALVNPILSNAGEREAEFMKTVGSFIPILDWGIDGYDTYNEFKQGNYGQSILSGLSFLPAADIVTKPIKALLKHADEVGATARYAKGIVTGRGVDIKGKWLQGSEGNLGLFPKEIAESLNGKTFNNFDDFRKAFWKEVANNPELSKQFRTSNIANMRKGNAPSVMESQQLKKQTTYILHHKTPIQHGGGVYDVDNLIITTPRYHKEILDPKYHY